MSPTRETDALALGTSTLYEASGLACSLDPHLRPAWSEAQLSGPALPILTAPGDNLPLHLALLEAQPGDVLVVDAGGDLRGYWGEVLTVAAIARGVAGLVIAGGVRDVDRLEALSFPVFSQGVSVRGTLKRIAGVIGGRLELGGTPVERGDLVVGDRDGVVVIPAAHVQATLESARRRQATEAAYMERLRAGELTVDIYDLQRP